MILQEKSDMHRLEKEFSHKNIQEALMAQRQPRTLFSDRCMSDFFGNTWTSQYVLGLILTGHGYQAPHSKPTCFISEISIQASCIGISLEVMHSDLSSAHAQPSDKCGNTAAQLSHVQYLSPADCSSKPRMLVQGCGIHGLFFGRGRQQHKCCCLMFAFRSAAF